MTTEAETLESIKTEILTYAKMDDKSKLVERMVNFYKDDLLKQAVHAVHDEASIRKDFNVNMTIYEAVPKLIGNWGTEPATFTPNETYDDIEVVKSKILEAISSISSIKNLELYKLLYPLMIDMYSNPAWKNEPISNLKIYGYYIISALRFIEDTNPNLMGWIAMLNFIHETVYWDTKKKKSDLINESFLKIGVNNLIARGYDKYIKIDH